MGLAGFTYEDDGIVGDGGRDSAPLRVGINLQGGRCILFVHLVNVRVVISLEEVTAIHDDRIVGA